MYKNYSQTISVSLIYIWLHCIGISNYAVCRFSTTFTLQPQWEHFQNVSKHVKDRSTSAQNITCMWEYVCFIFIYAGWIGKPTKLIIWIPVFSDFPLAADLFGFVIFLIVDHFTTGSPGWLSCYGPHCNEPTCIVLRKLSLTQSMESHFRPPTHKPDL